MPKVLAFSNYRALRDLVIPLCLASGKRSSIAARHVDVTGDPRLLSAICMLRLAQVVWLSLVTRDVTCNCDASHIRATGELAIFSMPLQASPVQMERIQVDRKDPKGFYAILQVTPNASAALIKAAYRHRAMELHPDRNKSANATAEFQLLTLAYNQLSDPKLRVAYDTQSAIEHPDRSGHAGKSAKTPSHEPIVCSRCSKVTAQPRYVVFREVKSFILATRRSPVQGIFCPACAERSAFRASAVTWLLGWWGIPWGPLYSIGALLTNLFGGEKQPLINARILTYQCIAFGLRGQTNVAIGIAREARKFSTKIPKSEPMRDSIIADLDKILASAAPNMPALVNGWRLWNRPFQVQGAVLSLVGLLLSAWIYQASVDHTGAGHAAKSATKPMASGDRRNPVARKPK